MTTSKRNLTKLLNPVLVATGGSKVYLGRCPMCGRKTRRSSVNSVGPRCVYDGNQFDRSGHYIWGVFTSDYLKKTLRKRAREVQAQGIEPVQILTAEEVVL